MRTCLVHPRSMRLPFPPLGLLSLAAVLERAGHEVAVLDPDPEDDGFIEELERLRPEAVGVGYGTTEAPRAARTVRLVRERLPDAAVVCGGPHPTADPVHALGAGAHLAVLGEGEATVLEAWERLERGQPLSGLAGAAWLEGGRLVRGPARPPIGELDSLPFPDRSLLPLGRYLTPPGVLRGVWTERSTSIIATRGCPGACTFCASHLMFGRRVRRRSPEGVADEARHLVEGLGVDGLWFADDCLTSDRLWLLRLCDELGRAGVDVPWGCASRVDAVSGEALAAMRAAGCVQVEYGVESGSQRVLDLLGKGTTVGAVRRAFRLTREAGLRAFANFMVGTPGEGEEDLEATLALARELRPDFALFFYTTPLPGTALYERALAEGLAFDRSPTAASIREPSFDCGLGRARVAEWRARLQNEHHLSNYLPMLLDRRSAGPFAAFLASHPRALARGLARAMATGNLDDLSFAFYEESQRAA